MDGISATWAHSVFKAQWRLEDELRALQAEVERLRSENAQLGIERDQLEARCVALHRKQFRVGRAKASPPPAEPRALKKRGPPFGHPPWSRPAPESIDRTIPVPAPIHCPHCACANLVACSEKVEQIQEDIVLQPRPVVTRFAHDTAFCPNCRRPVYATAPGELRNCSIGPVTKAADFEINER